MDIKQRLLSIIANEKITSSAFADSIGVQRSSISHILSGRNKPSLDFLQKILQGYPKYHAEWLITGQGEMLKSTNITATSSAKDKINDPRGEIQQKQSNLFTTAPDSDKVLSTTLKDELKDEDLPVYKKTAPVSKSDTSQLERIVFFYNDGSFKEYRPK